MEYGVETPTSQQAIIHLSGRLDAGAVQELKRLLKSTASDAQITQMIVNLAEVSFIDSSGLSALVSGFKAVRENNGTLVLVNVGPQIQVALELTRLNQIFLMSESIEAAQEHFAT